MTPQQIFLDEHGFTGPNLSNANQPFFVYGGVAIAGSRCAEIVSSVQKEFKLQGNELSASSLVSSGRGRAALARIMAECGDSARVVVYHKKFALGCKFFDYAIEPVVAEKNSVFYLMNFHRFVGGYLSLFMQSESESTAPTMVAFEHLLRGRGPGALDTILADRPPYDASSALSSVLEFVHLHRAKIDEEIAHNHSNPHIGKWVLDLTFSAAFGLLCHWGERYEQIEVFCDESKPLEAQSPILSRAVGDSRKIRQTFGDYSRQVTFNLAAPIAFVRSIDSPGIQLADAVVGAFGQAFKRNDEPWAKAFLDEHINLIHETSVLPRADDIDLDQEQPFINAMVLQHLIETTRTGENPLDALPAIVSSSRLIHLARSAGVKPDLSVRLVRHCFGLSLSGGAPKEENL